MNNTEEQELKKWVIQNMFDMEMNKLDDTKHELFLSFLEENKDSWFLQECFETFQKQKDYLDADGVYSEDEEEEEEEEEEQKFTVEVHLRESATVVKTFLK